MNYPACLSAVLLFLAVAVAAPSHPAIADEAPADDNCANVDGALDDAAFVIVTEPDAGDRVLTGFSVAGCSRTFESTVLWRLLSRDGAELASGVTQGGGVDGPGPFSFNVAYGVTMREIGHLEVFEEDASGGEGLPPGRTVLPLVLLP